MHHQNKEWEKPQLIILARGMPEESVLEGCKTQNPGVNIVGPGDETVQDQCAGGPDFDNCRNCKSRAFNVS